jgi:hypothetical protein
MSDPSIEYLNKMIAQGYDLLIELESNLLTESDATERLKITKQVDKIKNQISKWEEEFKKLSAQSNSTFLKELALPTTEETNLTSAPATISEAESTLPQSQQIFVVTNDPTKLSDATKYDEIILALDNRKIYEAKIEEIRNYFLYEIDFRLITLNELDVVEGKLRLLIKELDRFYGREKAQQRKWLIKSLVSLKKARNKLYRASDKLEKGKRKALYKILTKIESHISQALWEFTIENK